jgi:uncharacterized Zn finger protein
MIKLTCPTCSHLIKLTEAHIEPTVTCPECKDILNVPREHSKRETTVVTQDVQRPIAKFGRQRVPKKASSGLRGLAMVGVVIAIGTLGRVDES